MPTSIRITSPESTRYNCIAWAAEDNARWWWPDQMGIGFWPSGVPRADTLGAFREAFEVLGYEVTDSDSFESGFQKIALFVDENNRPKHAARQLINGLWTSKMGPNVDVEHLLRETEPLSAAGMVIVPAPIAHYGKIGLIMRRPA